ncbi:MAG TPA: PadR family transcriptional regulator [Homoserinimonas sp.]|nr:PadR family transcriptional regulator [Homoserinimonas sp.]
MSVRDGILGILTLGPAYGLQLHAEFMDRAPHRKPVNVGQVYGTLDRLVGQGLVASAGATDDGLPLYALTASGRQAASAWLTTPVTSPLPEWTEMLDQVLVAGSVDPAAALALSKGYRRWWEEDLRETREAIVDEVPRDLRLALLARDAQGVAALAWLGAAISDLAELDTGRALSPHRPKRGRRPQKAGD